jgi:hypothetical protein
MFDALVDRISAVMWNLRPAEAVVLGKHEYDGVVPDVSEEAVEEQLRRLRGLTVRLDSLEGLTRDQQVDRSILRAAADRVAFDHEVLRERHRNPMAVLNLLDVTPYLSRDYAPAAQRAARAAELLGQAPGVLAAGRSLLDPELPEVFCRWGIRTALGLAEALEADPAELLPGLGDERARAGLGEAARIAAMSLREHAAWIEAERLPDSDTRFQVGQEGLQSLLRHNELVETPIVELLALGEADLAANLEAFRETAAEIDGSVPPAEAYRRHVASVRPAAEGLVPMVADLLEGIRSFVVDAGLVTVPSEVRARVAPTPRHLRWAFALMDTPGPYEAGSSDAYYYVTTPEPGWGAQQVDEWLSALNVFALEDISVHEAYPGHYVHHLHVRSAPTEVSRRVASYAFVEGWAHYAEQLVWEAGYRDHDPRFRLAQLAEALVRDCRLVCALRMHAGDMSLPEAIAFFRENAFYEETPAVVEAERGTFDPGYFSYTFGKLQILGLRDDYRAARGAGFSLREFHDRLLSRGAPPVAVMRQELLS